MQQNSSDLHKLQSGVLFRSVEEEERGIFLYYAFLVLAVRSPLTASYDSPGNLMNIKGY